MADPQARPPHIGPNPYVGPNSFTAQNADHFFGRRDEVRQLAALVVAQRVVLFYAQSGAGKTSLLQAGLIPHLQEKRRVDVLPVVRVGGQGRRDQPLGPGGNVFVFNLLSDLYSEQNGGGTQPQNLAALSLQEGLAPFLVPDMDERRPRPRLLIIDQFEEFFTTPGNHPQARSDFFHQLQETLAATPRLTLLLSMREDYIASLDFYTVQMPDRLRIRFRMERLGELGALQAIVEPARLAGRRFESGVAEALVDNLRQVQTRRLGEAITHQEAAPRELGDYVEPVHLQIVCQELWERLPGDRDTIQSADVETYGDVDQALAQFYERAVEKAVAETGVNPRELRTWFGEKLITPAHTRSLLFQDAQTTEGMPNQVVAVLRNAFIVREVVRGGDLFYELAHDRLVEPILTANQRFHQSYFNPLAGVADRWAAAGRSADLLLGRAELTAAQRFARTHATDLLPVESEFLAASLRRRTQRRWMGVIAASVAAVLLAVVTFAVLKAVEINQVKLEQQKLQAIDDSRVLAAQAQIALAKGQLELGWKLALQAGQRASTVQALSAIRRALNKPIQLVHLMDGSRDRPIEAVGWSKDRNQVAAGDQDGYLWLWDLTTGQPLWSIRAHTASIKVLMWRPDDALLVSASNDGAVHLWRPQDGTQVRTLAQFGDKPAVAAGWNLAGDRLAAAGDQTVKIWDGDGVTVILDATDVHTATITLAEWSPDGHFFLTADEKGGMALWDGKSGQLIHRLVGHMKTIKDVDWLLGENRLLSGGLDKTVVVWDLAVGTATQTISSDVGSVIIVRWHPDGQRILMVGKESAASLWENDGSGPLARYVLGRDLQRTGTVNWSQDGTQLVTGDSDGHIRIWDVESGFVMNLLVGHTDTVQQVLLYPGDERLLSAGRESSIRLWNVDSAREIQILMVPGGEVEDVAWGRNQSEFVSVSGDGVMRLYTSVSQPEMPIIEAAQDRVLSAGWIDGDTHILTVGGNTVAIWDAQSSEPIFEAPHDGKIWSVRLQDVERLLMAASANGHTHIWQVDSGEEVAILTHPGDPDVYYARWDSVGEVIVTGAEDGSVGIWDPNTYKLRCWIQAADPEVPLGTSQTVNTVRFQKAGGLVVTSNLNGRVSMWDSLTCDKLYDLPTNFSRAYEAVWNEAHTQVLTYGDDDVPLIWDAERKEVVARLVDDQSTDISAVSAAWNKDETAVLAAGSDNVVRIWDAHSGKLRVRLEAAHEGRITTASWIKGDTQILTASYDGLVRISDAQSGRILVTLVGHSGWVSGATYHTLTEPGLDQSWDAVLSWGQDGTARLWSIDPVTHVGGEYAVLGEDQGYVNGAVLNKAGNQVMVWGEDGRVYRYYVYTADLLRTICQADIQAVRGDACSPTSE